MTIRNLIENIKRLKKLELWIALVVVLAILGLSWAVGFPIWEARQLDQHLISQGEYDSRTKLYSRIAEGLGAILPGLGGLALSGTAFAAIRNLRVAEDSRKLTEEKQVSDLFVKAVEMLADERLEVRIGGIYSLERIAKNSNRDHWTVMEVLTAFIQKTSDGEAINKVIDTYKNRKNKAFIPAPVSGDIQAALKVIGRRDITKDLKDPKDPNVGKGLSFVGGNFSGILFEEEADFRRTYLIGICCYHSYLALARFDNVDLSYADLRSSNLSGASFIGARLGDVDLRGANLKGAVFTEANLKGADLRGVGGRKAAQIVAAKNWWLAKYDDEFAQELTEFAQKQTEQDPKLAEQLRLFEQNRQTQSDEPQNPT